MAQKSNYYSFFFFTCLIFLFSYLTYSLVLSWSDHICIEQTLAIHMKYTLLNNSKYVLGASKRMNINKWVNPKKDSLHCPPTYAGKQLAKNNQKFFWCLHVQPFSTFFFIILFLSVISEQSHSHRKSISQVIQTPTTETSYLHALSKGLRAFHILCGFCFESASLSSSPLIMLLFELQLIRYIWKIQRYSPIIWS